MERVPVWLSPVLKVVSHEHDALLGGRLALCSRAAFAVVTADDPLWLRMQKHHYPHSNATTTSEFPTWYLRFARLWLTHARSDLRRVSNTKRYWDDFFADDNNMFDWFLGFDVLGQYITQHCQKTDRILIIGCGLSSNAYDLYALGYRNITSMDISTVAVDKMREKYRDIAPELKWRVADVVNMKGVFGNESFDAVIDKGVADTILFRTAAITSFNTLVSMFSEVNRLLTPNGRYLIFSPRKKLQGVAAKSQLKEYNDRKKQSIEEFNIPVWDTQIGPLKIDQPILAVKQGVGVDKEARSTLYVTVLVK